MTTLYVLYSFAGDCDEPIDRTAVPVRSRSGCVREMCGLVGATVGRVRGPSGQPVARIDLPGDTVSLMGGMKTLVSEADGDLSGRRSLLGGTVGHLSGTAERSGDADKRKGGEARVRCAPISVKSLKDCLNAALKRKVAVPGVCLSVVTAPTENATAGMQPKCSKQTSYGMH